MIGAAVGSFIATMISAILTLWDVSHGVFYGMGRSLAHALLAILLGAVSSALLYMGDRNSRVVGAIVGSLASFFFLLVYLTIVGVLTVNMKPADFQDPAFQKALIGSGLSLLFSGFVGAGFAFFWSRYWR
jgi:hypothetical protein